MDFHKDDNRVSPLTPDKIDDLIPTVPHEDGYESMYEDAERVREENEKNPAAGVIIMPKPKTSQDND